MHYMKLYRGKESIRRQNMYIDREFGACSRGVGNRTRSITI